MDPDPHQNVTDSQHWVQVCYILQFSVRRAAVRLHLCGYPYSTFSEFFCSEFESSVVDSAERQCFSIIFCFLYTILSFYQIEQAKKLVFFVVKKYVNKRTLLNNFYNYLFSEFKCPSGRDPGPDRCSEC